MRSERHGRWLAVAGAALLALPVAAQEEVPPERKRPDRGGRAQRDQTGDPRMQMPGRGQPQAPAMAVSDGNLFIVLGREIRRLDADTLEEEKKAEIPVPGADDETSRKMQEKFIKRFDKDGDGAVSGNELPRPELLDRLDKDGDGKVSQSEAPGPQMMAARMPAGPSTLLVQEGSVYVFQGGALYRFDAESLELEASAELAPKRPRGREKPDKGQRGEQGGRQKRPDRRNVPDEPPEPDDPTRF